MTITAIPHSPEVPSLEELDAAGVLAEVAEAEVAERRAGVRKLELALQWCVLHPATVETGAAVWGDAGLPGLREWDEHLGGEGTPLVAAFAPEPFAAALGISTMAGMRLLADALDLAHRLPTVWRKVQALEVAPWRGRRLAQASHGLSRQAAAYVDSRLAERIDSCGAVLIDRIVTQAAALYDPDEQTVAEEEAKASWDVKLHHPRGTGAARFAGTSYLEATGDALALQKLYDLVCDHAASLARLGDPDPLGARRAKALGMIADAHAHLALHGPTTGEQPGDERGEPLRRPSLTTTRLYLHLDAADLLDPLVPHEATVTGGGTGVVERLGPATIARIKQWLGHTRVTIVPVLDLARDDAVDDHDPPDRMRESVILRDRHCVFPWCTRDARACDLDHIAPYVPPDHGGPPGQTRPANLAPLCRRHHRAKTHGHWRYRRRPDGTYAWQGPHKLTYLVTPASTHAIPQSLSGGGWRLE